MSGEPVAAPRDAFDESAYLTALQTLALTPPVDRGAIQQAYRERAKRLHPDRFQAEEERAEATRRIQEINEAYRYAVQHCRSYGLARRWGSGVAAASDAPWHAYALVPVTAVYALTTLAAAAPFLLVGLLLRPSRRARLRDHEASAMAWRLWLLVAPHVATIALFALTHELAMRAWIGGSFLVMLSADVATLATGDTHGLRRPIQARLPKLS